MEDDDFDGSQSVQQEREDPDRTKLSTSKENSSAGKVFYFQFSLHESLIVMSSFLFISLYGQDSSSLV